MIDVISQRTEAHLAALNQLIEMHGETLSHFSNRLIDALMQEKRSFAAGWAFMPIMPPPSPLA